MIVRRKRQLIDACSGIPHSNRVRTVNLQRSVVRGDQRPGARIEKVLRHGNRQRRPLFRIGGRAQLIQQHKRTRIRQPRKTVEVDDVRGESRERLFDRLRIADVG